MAPEDIAKKTIDALAMPLGKRGPRARARRRPLSFRRPPAADPAPRLAPENLAPSPDAKRLKNKPLAAEWLWVPISDLKNRPLSSTGRKIAEFIEKKREGAHFPK